MTVSEVGLLLAVCRASSESRQRENGGFHWHCTLRHSPGVVSKDWLRTRGWLALPPKDWAAVAVSAMFTGRSRSVASGRRQIVGVDSGALTDSFNA